MLLEPGWQQQARTWGDRLTAIRCSRYTLGPEYLLRPGPQGTGACPHQGAQTTPLPQQVLLVWVWAVTLTETGVD